METCCFTLSLHAPLGMRVEINSKQDECEIRQTSNETNVENDEWTRRTLRYREYERTLRYREYALEDRIPMSLRTSEYLTEITSSHYLLRLRYSMLCWASSIVEVPIPTRPYLTSHYLLRLRYSVLCWASSIVEVPIPTWPYLTCIVLSHPGLKEHCPRLANTVRLSSKTWELWCTSYRQWGFLNSPFWSPVYLVLIQSLHSTLQYGHTIRTTKTNSYHQWI
jgi:hypothetical protein